jgi:hypothetical protein
MRNRRQRLYRRRKAPEGTYGTVAEKQCPLLVTCTFLRSVVARTGMQFHETILCATAPHTAGSGPGVIAIHDIQTGSTLATFKQTSAGNHSTAFVETRDGQGGFLLAAQLDKSILNVYNFQKVVVPLSAVFLKLIAR